MLLLVFLLLLGTPACVNIPSISAVFTLVGVSSVDGVSAVVGALAV
jgi:hypothetical protein